MQLILATVTKLHIKTDFTIKSLQFNIFYQKH